MVADEVICGFGRTGKMWGSETFNIKPDIITTAKALSSAYLPISAVILSDKVYKPIECQANELGIFGHGYTYSAHPVCAAVALKTQQIMIERDIISNVKKVSKVFGEGSIPNSFNAFLLTNPPQCSGLPTSNPSSKTKTVCPFFAISLAATSPEILPPATTTSYMYAMFSYLVFEL